MNPGSQRVICLDIGSSSIKSALIGANGHTVASGSVPLPCRIREDRCEIDTEELWDALLLAVKELNGSGADLRSADGFAVTSQMAGLVLLGAGFNPMGPIIPGVDRRGDDYVSELEDLIGRSLIHERTGCPLSGIYPASKLLCLAAEEPGRLRSARYIGGIKEYVLWRLTGAWVTDPASASVTQLYDQTARSWWPAMVAALEIGHLAFPRIANPDLLAGPLRHAAAEELGLVPGIPVTVGTGDGPAANLSTGVLAPGELCLSFGTTTVIRYVTEHLQPLLAPSHFRQHFAGEQFIQGFRLEGTGRQIAALLTDGKGSDYDSTAAGNGESLFFNPFGATEEKRFLGAYALASREEKLEAVLDGILFTVYSVMEPVWKQQRFRSVRPIGGGRKNELWMKRIADLLQIPVVLTNGGDSTVGAAMLLFKAIGAFGNLREAAAAMVRFENVLEPAASAEKEIRQRYIAYQAAVRGGIRP